jgi:MscS family membrane protein
MLRSLFLLSLLVNLLFASELNSSKVLPTQSSEIFTPLSPPATRSPRETLFEFISKINEMSNLIKEAEASARKEGGMFHSEGNLKKAALAQELLEQAVRTFDLSQVPEVHRMAVGLETALMLKDIFDRIPLPQPNEVPDISHESNGTIERWEVPGTEIAIVKGSTNEYSNEYLFSTDTIKRIPYFYDEVKDLEPIHKGLAHNMYKYYTSTPGNLLPPKWSFLLPTWSKDKLYWEQTLWQWSALILTQVINIIIIVLLFRWRRRHQDSKHAHSIDLTIASILFLIFWSNNIFIFDVLNITGQVYQMVSSVLQTGSYLMLSLFTYLLINYISRKMIEVKQGEEEINIDTSIIETLFKVFSIIAATAVLYFGAKSLGVPIAPLLAGFGALGLAIGMGAQEYFKNVIGGFTIFLDRHIKVGEYCEFDNIQGQVVKIGLRSTQILTDDKTLVTVQNSVFSTANISNYSRSQSKRFVKLIRLAHDTTSTKIINIQKNIKNFLSLEKLVSFSSVHFDNIDNSSLDIAVDVELCTTEHDLYIDFKEKFFLKVMEIVEQEGAEFAKITSNTTNIEIND